MARHLLPLALCVVSFLCFSGSSSPMVAAQTAASVPSSRAAEGSAALPAPRDVLGFAPGDDRTIADWRQITDYFARLDKASERVLVHTVGETTLQRPLIVAFISTPENLRNLDKYREMQRRLADPRLVADEAERDRLIREGRTVVAISCSIHSTEIVASQMSMQLAYELGTAADPETQEILQNTILILIPSANPDGVDIVANWYRKTLNTPYEGTEPPELYHPYAGHDNNRDWFMLNLKETQAITSLFWREWFPQIVYDVHQQEQTGARIFVPPFYDPPNPHIAPLLLRGVGALGYKMADDLQAAGQQGVLTNAKYDTWWHGGFRTAPYYHNSIGVLSEAASARLMTPVVVTRDALAKNSSRGLPSALQAATNFPDPWAGGLWRPRDIMRMEMTAVRSLLSMAAKHRADYLRNFYELGRRAVSYPMSLERPMAYLIPAGQGRDEAVAKMVTALVWQGVEVHRLDQELHIFPVGLTADLSHSSQVREVPAGSYLILLAQPFRANVQALFEPQAYQPRRTAEGLAEPPYDIAGWTLPMQMGVEAMPVGGIRELAHERRLTLIREEAEVRVDLALPLRPVAQGGKSPIANPLRRPVRVALYRGWTGTIDEGWTRFVLDTFNVPYSLLRDAGVRAGRLLERYDVIILPSARVKEITDGNPAGTYPPEFTGGITAKGIQNLHRFVAAGGTLICFGDSTELAIKNLNLPIRNVLEGVSSAEFYCPGSILRADVDTTHPMTRGMLPITDVYFINSPAFEVLDPQRARVVARYAERNVLRSGWLLGEKHIAGKAALVEVALGSGRVVLFSFRPQHRGQTWGTFPLIFGALESGTGKR